MSIPRFRAISLRTASPIGERHMFPEAMVLLSLVYLPLESEDRRRLMPKHTTSALISGAGGADILSKYGEES